MIPKKQFILLMKGVAVIIALFIFDIMFLTECYLALIGTIIVIVFLMSITIMRTTSLLPDVTAHLTEDAKSVIVVNRGTAAAYRVHISIVPLNIEFDAPDLNEDASHTHMLGTMISEAKGVVTFENSSGQKFITTSQLSALGGGEEDLLKPLFPLFKWK
jgi:hypothetical protein